MKDELGNRMKSHYENRTRVYLPRRTYTIIRIDGKCFGSYTKSLVRPFDIGLMDDMDKTAEYLCKKIQGAKLAFVQSDEISIVLTDFEKHSTDAWFDGNIQKIVSVASSLAASKFNHLRMMRIITESTTHESDGLITIRPFINDLFNMTLADFDARTFTIPSLSEVCNYMIWRQQDTVRNSISSVAQSLCSHKELEGKNNSVQQEMIHEKGQNWNDYPPMQKRGRFVYKKEVQLETPYVRNDLKQSSYTRNVWVTEECPTFTQDQNFLLGFIPENN